MITSVPISPYPNIIFSYSFDQRLSMEFHGKGSFQDVEPQTPTWTTVCSHPAKGMAIKFHQIQRNHDDIQNQRLCCCEHLRTALFSIVKLREIPMNFRRVRWSAALISMGAFAVAPGIRASDLSAAGIQGSQQPGNPNPNDPNGPNNPPNNPNGPNPPAANNPEKPYAPKKAKNPKDRKSPLKNPVSGSDNTNPPSGPNNPNPPSDPAPTAPSGAVGTGGTGEAGSGTR